MDGASKFHNRVAKWVNESAPATEVVAQRRDIDGPMIDRAIDIVKKFIIERNLILFGGQAIDYALRLKGTQIYPDDQRPDLDFLSTNSVDDAYDLADILQNAGFESVGAIRGIHVQTMRVRTDYHFVADIGYAPEEVFKTLPTFEYQGMRVVHPDYQRMDMHLAFCYPFNNPPREDVFHRWKKDLKRFNIYEEFYPIRGAESEIITGGRSTRVTAKLAVPIIGSAQKLTVALHGFAAYSILRSSLDEFASALNAEIEIAAPTLELTFPDSRSFSIETPEGKVAHIASPDPDSVFEGKVQWYDPYMDIYPETAKSGSLVVMSTRGRLLAASVMAAPTNTSAQIRVVSPQYLLLWLLFEAHRAGPGKVRGIYRTYYNHTLEILRAAETVYADVLDAETNPEVRAKLMDVFAHSPFAPTLDTLGTVNNNAAYVIKMATNAMKLRDTPPPVLNLEPDIAKLLDNLPGSYYPATAKKRPVVDYEANPLFHRAGQLRQ